SPVGVQPEHGENRVDLDQHPPDDVVKPVQHRPTPFSLRFSYGCAGPGSAEPSDPPPESFTFSSRAFLRGGTGASAPGCNGWHRAILRTASHSPRRAPWVGSACPASALQGGQQRQPG